MRDIFLPAVHLFVDGFVPGEFGRAKGQVVEGLSVFGVGDADFEFFKARKNIELGDDQLCHAVDTHGIAQQDAIQPADAARAPGGGAVFIPGVCASAAQTQRQIVKDFGREGACANTGLEGFADTSDDCTVGGGQAETEFH